MATETNGTQNSTVTQTGAAAEDGAGGPRSVPIVLVIGALAAETGSLVRVLAELPADAELAVVLALRHREAFDEEGFRRALGARAGALAAVVDGAAVEAGRIYMPAPDPVVTVEGGRFRTRPAEAERGPGGRAAIDGLLVSLAHDQDGHTIGLVLAGTGGDGTLGLAAVKEAGGLTLAEAAQDTDPAAPDASNGPAALADAVLPAGEIAGRIALHVRHLARLQAAAAGARAAPAEAADVLARIAAVLLERTGHDFHGYKRPTFLRRVQRRMQVVGADTFDAYLDALHARPDEAQHLFNDLLIGVTRFFRDAREFEALQRDVVPRLFEGKGRGDRVRVWVLGCSTGEEAYSIAILLREHAARLDAPPGVQVFATNLDGRALAVARAGRYPASIAGDISPERLARWFVEEDTTYAVARELRDVCVFSQHSLIKDMPFSHLDLVSCRNLLIYLGPELQERVIPLFHFALKPGGYLFLGTSEGVARHTGLFAPVARGVRIFRKLETGRRVMFDVPAPTHPQAAGPSVPQARPRPSDPGLVRRAERLAERHAPAYAVVDEAYDVLHFSPRAGRYIHPAGGAASLNLLDLVHADLRLHLRGVLGEAARAGRTVRVDGVPMDAEGQRSVVDIVVEPVPDDPGASRGYVVLFKEGSLPPDAGEGSADAPAPSSEHVRRLEAGLRATRERLQVTVEQLEGTNEELKASNEEYQSLNEELQSANEELATSKEELQSLNEELTTVNHELAHRVDELGRVNSDLKNLLQATRIATVFLDRELRVTNFTPAAAEVFHLVEGDLGRPIAHIKSRVTYEGLQDDVRRVLHTLAAVEREVEAPATGARYMARVLPYRSVDNVIAGAVVTFTDVTALARAQERLRESEELRGIALESGRMGTWRWDTRTRLIRGDAEFQTLWGVPPSDGPHPVELFTARVSPDGAVAMGAVMAKQIVPGEEFDGQLQIVGGPSAGRWIRWRGRAGRERPWIIDGVSFDVTEQRLAEERLRESEERFRGLVEGWAQAVWEADAEGSVTADSPSWRAHTGQSVEAWLGHGWLDAVHPDDRAIAARQWREAVAARRPMAAEVRLHHALSGGWRWTNLRTVPIAAPDGTVRKWAGMNVDIHDRREAEAKLRESEARLAADLVGMRRLYELHARLAIETDLGAALGEILAAACEFTGTDRGYVRLVGDDGERLEMFAWRGYAADGPFISRFRHEGFERGCDVAPVEQQRQIIEDTATFPGLAGTEDGAAMLAEGIRAAQSTPLLNRKGETIGVLSTQFRRPHRPSEDELRLIDLLAWTAADFVERHRGEGRLRESEARFRQFGEASPDVLWIRDAEALRYEYLSPAFETVYGGERGRVLEGDDFGRWAELIHPEDREAALGALDRVRRGERVTHEYRIRRPSDGEVRWLRDTDFPLLDEHGRVQRLGGIGQDVTEEKEVAERQGVLVAELQHRTRNLLAVVRSLAEKTMVGSTGLDEFRDAFRDRLSALSRVQGLLSRLSGGERVTFDELIRAELTALGATDTEGRGPQVSLDGPKGVRLRSSTVQTFALALHELATNAVKYGALSRPEGRLRVTWCVEAADGQAQGASRSPASGGAASPSLPMAAGDPSPEGRDGSKAPPPHPAGEARPAEAADRFADGRASALIVSRPAARGDRSPSASMASPPVLHVDWRESGVTVPEDGPTRRRGYGRELIERALPYQLKARTHYEFGPDGVSCSIAVPISAGRAEEGTEHA